MTQYVELKLVLYVDSVNIVNRIYCTYDDCLFVSLFVILVYSSHKNVVNVESIIKLFIVYVMVIAPPLPLLHIIYKYLFCVLHVGYLHLTYKLMRICDKNTGKCFKFKQIFHFINEKN